MKKLNKKWLILLPVLIALIVFVSLYYYYNSEDSHSLTVSDRKWIEDNASTVFDFEVISNYPIYGSGGVFYDFISSLEEDVKLEFNLIPRLKNADATGNGLRFRVLANDQNLTDKDLFVANDVYVIVSKQDLKINRVSDLQNITLGVFTSDVGEISYYLKSGTNLTYKPYDTIDTMMSALNGDTVGAVIVPSIMYLDKTISNDDYYINYTLTEMNKKIVLTLSNNNERLNSIVRKYFNNWKNNKYVNVYNKNLLDYYISNNKVNDKTRAS